MATHSKGDNVGKTISLDRKLASDADGRRKRLNLPSFSAYVQKLVREDLKRREALVFDENGANGSGGPRNKRTK